MGLVFLDESGKFGDSDFVCLAGYVCSEEGWHQFSDKWQKLLLRHNVPFIHMAEMMALKAPYDKLGWDRTKRDQVLAEFIDVIREFIWAGFAIAVEAKYLRTRSAETRKRLGNPQEFCFQRMVGLILKTLNATGYEPRIGLVFDDADDFSVKCYKAWSKARRRLPHVQDKIPAITFADDRHYWPLQAADILAWESNKSLRLRQDGHEPRPQIYRLMQAPEDGYGLEYHSEHWKPHSLDWLDGEIKAGKVFPL